MGWIIQKRDGKAHPTITEGTTKKRKRSNDHDLKKFEKTSKVKRKIPGGKASDEISRRDDTCDEEMLNGSGETLSIDDLEWKTVETPFMPLDARDDAPGAFLGLEEIEGVDVEIVKAGGGKMIKFKRVEPAKKASMIEPVKETDNLAGLTFIHMDDFTEPDEALKDKDNNDDENEKVKGQDLDMTSKPEKKGNEAHGNINKAKKEEKTKKIKEKKKHVETKNAEEELQVEVSERQLENNDDFESDLLKLDAWKRFNLNPLLLRGIALLKFLNPTEIQALTLKSAIDSKSGNISDRDIIGAAETGSGKTLAYGLPLLQEFANERLSLPKNDAKKPCLGLILTPTRELAIQVTESLKAAAKFMKVHIVTIVGGISQEKQLRLISYGPDIIVATPGRLWELASNNNILLHSLRAVRFLVLDEADRMLESGHFKDLDTILGQISWKRRDDTEENPTFAKPESRRTYVFSATLPTKNSASASGKKKTLTLSDFLKKLEFQDKNPVYLNASPSGGVAGGVVEAKIDCLKEDKDSMLYYLLTRYPGRTFKQVENSILVASDVAARGLDIPTVDHVIHFQVPRTSNLYIHRSGRTARAHNTGISVLLCSPEEVTNYKKLCSALKKPDGLPDFPVDFNILTKLKGRVSLARKIESENHKLVQSQRKDDWIQKAAMDAEIILDSESEDEDTQKVSKKAQKKAELKLAAMKADLDAMLVVPVIPRNVSSKYLTSNVERDVAGILANDEGTETLPTKRPASAINDVNKKRKIQ
ncbi:ATP-dependent RNA helicase [Phlyctochytrium planicorne]|nr:ATP-dependent RNA helicase [Phlyctochytrium planicorne]